MRILTLTLLTFIVLGTFSAQAQNAALNGMFDKYAEQNGFEYKYIDAEMLEQEYSKCSSTEEVNSPEKEDVFIELIEQFEGLSVLIWDGQEEGKSNRLYNEAEQAINTDKELEELLSVSGEELSVRGLIRESRPGVITELIVSAREGENFVLVQLKGALDLAKAFQYTRLLATFDMYSSDEAEEKTQVSIPSKGIASVEIWPNPSSSTFNVQYFLTKESALKYIVIDATGRIVEQSSEELLSAGTHTMIWQAPSAGMYTLVLQTENQQESYRLIASQ